MVKIPLILTVFLGFAGVCSSEPLRLEVTVSPLIIPNQAIKVTIDRDILTIRRGEDEPEIFRPGLQETKSLRAAILASSPKDWDGFWGSMDYLDGYILRARLEHDGKKYTFGGWNGCPAGFAAILKRINEITKAELFSNNWEEMEKSAKRYKSFEGFIETTTRSAKEKRTKKPDMATPRKPSD